MESRQPEADGSALPAEVGEPLDVEALLRQIREAARRPRPRPETAEGRRPDALRLYRMNDSLRQFEGHLRGAVQHSQMGMHPPGWSRFRGALGYPVRLIARLIQKATNFLTSEQRHFNYQVLNCLWDLRSALHHLEQSRAADSDAEPPPEETRQRAA